MHGCAAHRVLGLHNLLARQYAHPAAWALLSSQAKPTHAMVWSVRHSECNDQRWTQNTQHLLYNTPNAVPVLQTFFVDDDLKDACQLDAVLTVVDSKHLIQHLDEVKPADVVNEAGGASAAAANARQHRCECCC